MKQNEEMPEDDIRLVVTNLEEEAVEDAEGAEVESLSAEDEDLTTDAAAADDAEDVPVATIEGEDGPESKRSVWRLFSAEELPQLSLREILGGDYLLGSFLRKNIWFILLIVLLSIFYISNRYAAQQEIIEEENLRNELVEKKNYALTQYAILTMNTRQSSIERRLRLMGDSLLQSATDPPFLIRTEK